MKTFKLRIDYINLLIILVILLSLLILPNKSNLEVDKANTAAARMIEKVVQHNDIVFVDAEVDMLIQVAKKTNATILPFTTYINFESQFKEWLDDACNKQVPEEVKTYFVWGKSDGNRFVDLSPIFRIVYFFASFEGVDSVQTDQVFLIRPREEKLEYYCKAKEFLESTKTNSLTLIVEPSLFSPLSGKITFDRLTLLPNDPVINISYDKLLVKNWDRQFHLIPKVDVWDYSEKEYSEYKMHTSQMESDMWVVISQNLQLGALSNTFFVPCELEKQEIAQSFGYKALCKK